MERREGDEREDRAELSEGLPRELAKELRRLRRDEAPPARIAE